jgi:hypothetical protein
MAASPLRMSLFSYLTERNPQIRYRETGILPEDKIHSSTKNPIYLTPSFIRPWKEFDIQALKQIYDGQLQDILLRKPDKLRTFVRQYCENKEVWHETSLEWHVLAKWNQEVVQEALLQSSDDLGLGRVFMERGWAALPLKDKLKPDWAGMQAPGSWNILPGESKYHSTFKSSVIEKNCPRGRVKPSHTGETWLQALKQIFTYCVRSFSRYGYIITDRELCVVRVGVSSRASSGAGDSQQPDSQMTDSSDLDSEQKMLVQAFENSGEIQYRSIPWETFSETENSNEITINLALWWLHILAAVNGRLSWEYKPLAEERIGEDGELTLLEEQNAGGHVDPAISQEARPTSSFVSTLGIPGLYVSSPSPEPDFVPKSGRKRGRGQATEQKPKTKKKSK